MRYRFALIVVCCSIIVGCLAYLNDESTREIVDENVLTKIEFLTSFNKEKQYIANIKQSVSIPIVQSPIEYNFDQLKFKTKEISGTDCYASVNPSSYMTLEKTGRKNALGNPLYKLCLYAEGQLKGAYHTVTGRFYTQNRNRNRSKTQAPAPDGKYKVAKHITYSPLPEIGVGQRFLQVDPLFPTARTELGLHYDPSFEKRNGQDGTSGCIALTSRANLDKVFQYFRTYRPKYMFVDIE